MTTITYSNYDELPSIRVVKQQLFKKLNKSAGFIIRCKSSSRFYLVEKRHSNNYLPIVSDRYYRSELPYLISTLTPTERDDIKQKADKGILKRSSLVQNIMSVPSVGSSQISKWFWPKGRIDYRNNESAFNAAKRELLEESCMTELPSDFYVYDETIELRTTGSNCQMYSDIFWVAEVENEFETKGTSTEISDTKWMSEDSIREILSPHRATTLDSALSILKS